MDENGSSKTLISIDFSEVEIFFQKKKMFCALGDRNRYDLPKRFKNEKLHRINDDNYVESGHMIN